MRLRGACLELDSGVLAFHPRLHCSSVSPGLDSRFLGNDELTSTAVGYSPHSHISDSAEVVISYHTSLTICYTYASLGMIALDELGVRRKTPSDSEFIL
jgi:hypothetical protein